MKSINAALLWWYLIWIINDKSQRSIAVPKPQRRTPLNGMAQAEIIHCIVTKTRLFLMGGDKCQNHHKADSHPDNRRQGGRSRPLSLLRRASLYNGRTTILVFTRSNDKPSLTDTRTHTRTGKQYRKQTRSHVQTRLCQKRALTVYSQTNCSMVSRSNK